MRSGELQQMWRAIVRRYPSWTAPIDLMISPSSWRLIGVDLLRGPFRERRAHEVAALLAPLDEAALDRLGRIAEVNHQRAAAVFKAVAVSYVSLPIAVTALLSDVAPDILRSAVEANLRPLVGLLIAAALGPLVYFCAMWRARQIVWVIELCRAGSIEPAEPTMRKRTS